MGKNQTSDRPFWFFIIFLFLSSTTLGLFRFGFPFLIVDDGFSLEFVAETATMFSIAIVLGLFIGIKLGQSKRKIIFSIMIISLISCHLFYAFGMNELTWLIARFFDGLFFGLTYYLILSIALVNYPKKSGEKSALLLASTFLGSALGQALYSFLLDHQESLLREIPLYIGVMATLILIPVFPSTIVSVPCERDEEKTHGHIRKSIRSLLSKQSIALLLLIAFVEISHGLYTPILTILLENNGLTQQSIGYAFFYFNIGWSMILVILGRFADRINPKLLLVSGPLLKGPLILLYLISDSLSTLIFVLVLIGIAEGFFEPAKNVYLSRIDDTKKYDHTHHHLSLVDGALLHSHPHMHEVSVVEIGTSLAVSTYFFFAVGTFISSLLLSTSISLSSIIWWGAITMVLASIAGLFVKNNPNNSSEDHLTVI